MRLGVAWIPNSNANYRALNPMKAMARRGHEIVWPPKTGEADVNRLAGCDVVHVYRRATPDTQRTVAALGRAGTAVTFDNDDDLTAIPKESPDYKKFGGATAQRLHAMSVAMARSAQCFTTTNEALARKYRKAGARRVEIIGNHLDPDLARPRVDHEGIVIGWVGGIDHQADVVRIDIAGALQRLVEAYPVVKVECIGVDLRLPDRYGHIAFLPFNELPRRIGGWDIGVAPLADIPANRTRSDIKLKEYAASGVPWLASPRGPYTRLGEGQGGRLVSDDGWFEALERLVSHPAERLELSRAARSWAETQWIDAAATRWESVFASVAEKSAKRSVTLPSGRTVRLRSRRDG